MRFCGKICVSVRPAQTNWELTELATGFTVRDYQTARDLGEASRDRIAEAIKLRFTERYIAPALNQPRNGFTMMAIACLMIEALECFRQGLDTSEGRSRRVFRALVESVPPLATFAPLSSELHSHVRCGILHQAETTGGWKVVRQGPLFDQRTLTINATLFLDALREILHEYCEGLKTAAWTSPDWNNVRTRTDAICANCHP
jgi:hypothetical protein